MAVTKIWKINGWIGDCLLYIENPNKTQNPLVIGDPKLKEEEYQSLIDVIEYAEDGNKTVRDTERFVSGVNCDAETARQEMILAKNAFDKNDGICAYHAIQSFAPGEVTPETAHEIGIRLAKEMWGERYQVLVATHLDHEHLRWFFRRMRKQRCRIHRQMRSLQNVQRILYAYILAFCRRKCVCASRRRSAQIKLKICCERYPQRRASQHKKLW